MRYLASLLAIVFCLLSVGQTHAQDEGLHFLTIDRPPFSYLDDGNAEGFSIDLMRQISSAMGQEVRFTFVDEFSQLLDGVANGDADGAVANISITSEREALLDFSRPIFGSGLKILVSGAANGASIWDVVFRWELLALILAGFGMLFVLGMLMWVLERKHQDYFKDNARDAMFPSFWWALNLVINGGFEVNVPRSILGRLLAVVMVVSSLFVVSLFVASITASLTVEAISGSIQSLDDLRGRRVGTTQGSTASLFLDERDVTHTGYGTFTDLMDAFEAEELDAVVFDGPILEYYLTQSPGVQAYLLERLFRPQDYGIAFAQGSDLREPVNRALLRLSEAGEYQDLRQQWFGTAP
ncbi:transporter substrate-binding domain-containing protein [Rhodobacteraceae bacterium M385]|nr:transporter substrate-binding domain-containing protein [Rhodobacteraceae bacterium M385]